MGSSEIDIIHKRSSHTKDCFENGRMKLCFAKTFLRDPKDNGLYKS